MLARGETLSKPAQESEGQSLGRPGRIQERYREDGVLGGGRRKDICQQGTAPRPPLHRPFWTSFFCRQSTYKISL